MYFQPLAINTYMIKTKTTLLNKELRYNYSMSTAPKVSIVKARRFSLDNTIENIFNKIQKGNSKQQVLTTTDQMFKMIKAGGGVADKKVAVYGNIEFVQLMLLLKHQASTYGLNESDWNYKNITFFTDIKSKYLTTSDLFNTVKVDLHKPHLIKSEEKFDLVLSNNIFSKGTSNSDLYNLATEAALKMSTGKVVMTAPATAWTKSKKAAINMRKQMNRFGVSNILTEAPAKDMNNPIKNPTKTSIFVCDNRSEDTIESLLSTDGSKLLDKVKSQYTEDVLKFKRGGVRILNRKKDEHMFREIPEGNFSLPHLDRVAKSTEKQEMIFVPHEFNNKAQVKSHNVIFPERGSVVPSVRYFGLSNWTSSINVCCVSFDSKRECENYMHFTKTDFYKFLIVQSRGGGEFKTVVTNPNQFRNNIPCLDFSRSWSDEDLVEHFNMSKKDVKVMDNALIEAKLK